LYTQRRAVSLGDQPRRISLARKAISSFVGGGTLAAIVAP